MSMVEFATCLGIYTREELAAPHFKDYLFTGAMIEIDFYPKDVWHEFSQKPYLFGGSSYKDMDNMQLKVIQRCLAHTIAHRKENTEKVTALDMWFLRKFVAEENINIPYAAAWYLHHSASGIRGESPICGGHFVPRIAKAYKISFEGLQRVPDKPMTVGATHFKGAHAISIINGNYRPYQAEAEEQAAPPRRRQRQTRQAEQNPQLEEEAAYDQGGFQQQGAAQPSMLHLMQGIQALQVGHDNFYQEARYEFGAQRYHNAWSAHNTRRLSEVVPNFQHTPYHYPPMWGQPGASYPPPVYDESAALAELQEEYRRQQERQQEERGFPYDYSPF